MSLDLSRRHLFGGTAAALGLLATDSLTTQANAATLQGALPASVDTVVIGGGLSGLVAAREVARAGRSVVVVEARSRVGGRLLNHRLASGEVIEAGGAFIGPTQDHIAALADELGVATFPEYVDGKSVYLSPLLGRSTFTGTVPPDPTILLDALLLLQQINKLAAQVSVEAPWSHPRAAEWDAITLAQFIRRATLNKPAIERLLACWTQPGFGADPDELSFLFVLHYLACSGNETTVGTFERNSDTKGGAQERRFDGGSQLVPLRLAAQLGTQVALAAAVSRVDQTADGAIVTTARGPVRCRRVIAAAPPPMLLGITWNPGLPAARRSLLERMPMGKLMKCDAVYERPFWRDAGLNGYGLNHSGPVRVAFDNSPADGSPGVLLAFVGGSTWRQYGTLAPAARRTAVLEGFAAMFGKQALAPIEFTEHQWPHERWTRGGPVAVMGPGVLSTVGSAIRTPHGRVHWAGTETSTYWTGYMDGAVRAGERAAAEVLAAP